MIKLLLIIPLIFGIACSSSNKKVERGFAASSIDSVDDTESETSLGVINRVVIKKRKELRGGKVAKWVEYESIDERAVRGYFRKAKENDGSYNFVLLEYPFLWKVAPKYILSNKASHKLNKKIGYLNYITERAVLYKAIPTGTPREFELQRASISGGKLVHENKVKVSKLILDKDPTEVFPLEGARINPAENGEKSEIIFPKESENGLKYGGQYLLAKWVYSLIPNFRSTWRMAYLTGDYLAAYGDVGGEDGKIEDEADVVLKLSNEGQKSKAHFFKNPHKASMDIKKREKQFTNPKSAHITGNYTVNEIDEGIFVFNVNKSEANSGSEDVDQRIGLFLDVFDASQTKLNQDVVELVILNPDDDKDFLMYYEHPDNGEGR